MQRGDPTLQKDFVIGRESSTYGIECYLEMKYVCMGGLQGVLMDSRRTHGDHHPQESIGRRK